MSYSSYLMSNSSYLMSYSSYLISSSSYLMSISVSVLLLPKAFNRRLRSAFKCRSSNIRQSIDYKQLLSYNEIFYLQHSIAHRITILYYTCYLRIAMTFVYKQKNTTLLLIYLKSSINELYWNNSVLTLTLIAF